MPDPHPSSHPADPAHLYELLVSELTDFAVFLTDPAGYTTSWNPGVKHLLGYPESEWLGQTARMIFTPEDRAAGKPEEEMAQAVRDGRAPDIRWHQRKDGSRLFVDGVMIALRDGAGQVLGFAKVMRDVTERKQAEEALQQQEKYWRNLADQAPAMLWLTDPDAQCTYLNQRWCTFTGIPLEQGLGLGWLTSIHPDDREAAGQVFLAANERREAFALDYRVRRHDGAWRWTIDAGEPRFSTSGEYLGYIGTLTDITERKRVELREAFLVQLDDATRPLTDPHEITQVAARLLSEHLEASRCAYATVEADEDTFDLTGDYNRGVPSIVGRYSFTQFGAECLRLMREGKPYVVEDSEEDPRTEAVRASYRLTLIRSVVCVSLLKQGRFVAAMAVHHTTPRQWRPDEVELVQLVANRCWESIERASVTRDLRDSERRLRLAQRAGRTGSFEWFIKENQIIWTPELEALYGLPEGSFEGNLEAWRKRVDIDDAERVTAGIADCIDKRRAEYDYQFRAVWPGGTRRWLRGQAQFFYDAAGAPERMVGINIDIDSQRQAEEALRKTNRELEEFAYVASHDLQEPLRTVNIYTQLLLRRSLGEDAEAQEYAGFIRDSVTRMQDLIRDLLSYSRTIHTGGTPTGSADLSESLAQALLALKGRIEETGATVQAGPLPAVQGDAMQLAHVFQNLLSNALKYRRKEVPAAISVSAELKEKQWIISVQDNGIGFNQQHAERIFGLFKRLHRDEYPGTGLGLAICRRIVERYGGKMWAESEPGVGSAFFFTLPA